MAAGVITVTDGVIMANNVMIGGHVHIGDAAWIGGARGRLRSGESSCEYNHSQLRREARRTGHAR